MDIYNQNKDLLLSRFNLNDIDCVSEKNKEQMKNHEKERKNK